MGKRSEKRNGLKKSTKITMWSCGGFVLASFAILVFFVMNPITPNERMISNLGRENYSRKNDNQATPVAVTTAVNDRKSVQTSVVATSPLNQTTTAHIDFEIKITTGSGFLWNARIPTDANPYTATVISPKNYGEDQNYVDYRDYIEQNGGTVEDDKKTQNSTVPATEPVTEAPAEPDAGNEYGYADPYYDPNYYYYGY